MLTSITPLDFQILTSIQDILACPVSDAFFSFITHLGDSGFIWIVFTLILLSMKRFRAVGVAAFIALALVTLLGEFAIKFLVARPRPFIQDPSIALIIAPPSGYSFPSIHAASSLAVAVTLCAFPALYKRRQEKVPVSAWIIAVGSVVLALLIAFSRLYVRVHFPSDVFCGLIFGLICGIAALYITQYLYQYKQKRAQ